MATQAASVSLNMFSLPVCTVILSHIQRSIFYNTNSRQKCYAIILAVGGRFTRGVYTLRYRQSSCPLISGSVGNIPRWTHIGASLVASSTPLHGSAVCGGCNMNDAAVILNSLQQRPHRETECCLANWDTSKLSSGPKHSKKI
jgi:hypothetical protein